MQFIDSVGNIFINQPPVYVYVTGRRQQTHDFRPAHDGAKRAFDPKGLIVTYAFLCFPERLNASYREIAEKTGVAVGTVIWVVKALAAGEFIADTHTGGKINEKKMR